MTWLFFSIAFILVILFIWGAWGISSEEIDEKTQKASRNKTAVMFIITLAIAAFYYKTYNVATMKNVIKIKGIKCAVDSFENSVDTIDYVIIRSSFTDAGTKYHRINEITGENYFEYGEGAYGNTGGSGFAIRYKIDSLFPIKKISDYELYGIDPQEYEHSDHVYHYEYMASYLPTLVPYSFVAIEKDYGLLGYQKGDYGYQRIIYGTPNDSTIRTAPEKKIRDFIGDNAVRVSGETGTTYLQTFIDNEVSKNPKCKDSLVTVINLQWDDINTMNLLTAADLTQCSYDILYDFDCPVKRLYITFDIPTSLSQLPYGIKPIDSYSYKIDNPEFFAKKKAGSLLLHINFPTLSNMQLIRSLVLTSLLTAFFSLFCLNAYYCFRKYYKDHPKGRKWKTIYRAVIGFIILIIICMVYLMMTEKTIMLKHPVPMQGVEYYESNA